MQGAGAYQSIMYKRRKTADYYYGRYNSLIISLTGSQSKIDSFIELLDGFKITELARTGITGLARGAASLK